MRGPVNFPSTRVDARANRSRGAGVWHVSAWPRDGRRRVEDRARQIYGKAQGFTLIEVMVALTITGFLLGGLFTLVAGSKRLSAQAETALARSLQQRAAFNAALLDNDFAELDSFLSTNSAEYRVVELDELELPDRQTQALPYALQAIELQSPDGDVEVVATRWQRLGVGVSQ